jgi:hypothetical protein
MKLIALINVLNEMCNQDQVYIYIYIFFPIQNGQRQGDVVLTLPFNIAVNYAIRKY